MVRIWEFVSQTWNHFFQHVAANSPNPTVCVENSLRVPTENVNEKESRPGVPFTDTDEFKSQHGSVITCPVKCGKKLLNPFPNVNGRDIEVWEWIGNSITYFIIDVVTYSC